MNKQKNFQLAIIAVLTFAVLFMSVGFAAYSRNLNINGTTTVAQNKWSVHFVPESLQIVDSSVLDTKVNVQEGSTAATFSATLAKPGDFAAFKIDAINDGTFNAMLDSITMTGPSVAQDAYLNYSVEYDGQSFTTSTEKINDALPFSSGINRKTLLVRVEFDINTPAEKLPKEDTLPIELGVSLGYSQAQ